MHFSASTGFTAIALLIGAIVVAVIATFIILKVLNAGIERFGALAISVMAVCMCLGVFIYVGVTKERGAQYFVDKANQYWADFDHWLKEKTLN